MEPTAHFNRDNTAGPRATYRLQFHEGFTLNQARALVPYLHEIGISHIYSSPLFKARPHSTHGYDTCDFTQLNPELGTEADLAELAAALRAFKMGLILDIAPNHMGIGGPENRWWWDVLARGPESQFAKFFDIDWNSADPRLRGKVLTPVLGDRYHRLVEKHELRVENSRGTCILRYGDNSFPINGASLKAVRVSLEELNSNPEALDALLEMQFYRLAWFGGGDSDLNYRRFCNISSLPRLCIEDEQVFNQVFALTGQWLQHGWLDGLRVDHIDGLKVFAAPAPARAQKLDRGREDSGAGRNPAPLVGCGRHDGLRFSQPGGRPVGGSRKRKSIDRFARALRRRCRFSPTGPRQKTSGIAHALRGGSGEPDAFVGRYCGRRRSLPRFHAR